MPSTSSWWLISFQELQSINSDSNVQAHPTPPPAVTGTARESELVSQTKHATFSLRVAHVPSGIGEFIQPQCLPSHLPSRLISPAGPPCKVMSREDSNCWCLTRQNKAPPALGVPFQSTNGKRKRKKKDGLKSIASFYQTRTCSSRLTISRQLKPMRDGSHWQLLAGY